MLGHSGFHVASQGSHELFGGLPLLAITDQRGRSAAITGTDVLASNGVVHVIDRVILPRP